VRHRVGPVRWTAGDAGPPVVLRHRGCGQLTLAEVRFGCCGELLEVADVDVEPGPGAGGDRTAVAR
jgi:hypothetical protein